MARYAGRWADFLRDIKTNDQFVKDQWQFQMHTRALEKIGEDRLYFVTDGIDQETLQGLSVSGLSVSSSDIRNQIQERLDQLLASGGSLAVFPEGPYCVSVME